MQVQVVVDVQGTVPSDVQTIDRIGPEIFATEFHLDSHGYFPPQLLPVWTE